MTPIEPLLSQLEPILRTEILRVYSPDCCIVSCRILQTLLAEAGMVAHELPVQVMVTNRVYAEAVTRGEQLDRVREQHPEAWSVGIGFGTGEPRKWPGHLVLIYEGFLLDPSLSQANRPERGIQIPDLIRLQIDDPAAMQTGEWFAEGALPDGTAVVYQAKPRETGYLFSPQWWSEHNAINTITDRIRRRLTKES